MSNATTIPQPINGLVTAGWPIFDTTDPNGVRAPRTVLPESWDACLTPDMFVVEWTNTGARAFAKFTGRTRRQWGIDCPTVVLFDIETVVELRPTDDPDFPEGAPVIMSGIGARRPGTFGIRPEAVTFLR